MTKKSKTKEAVPLPSEIDPEELKAMQVLKRFVRERIANTKPEEDVPFYELLDAVGDDPVKSGVTYMLETLLDKRTMKKVLRIFFEESGFDGGFEWGDMIQMAIRRSVADGTPKDQQSLIESMRENVKNLSGVDIGPKKTSSEISTIKGSEEGPTLYDLLHHVGDDVIKVQIESRLKKELDEKTLRTIRIGFQLGIEGWEGGDLDFELQRELAELRFDKFLKLEDKEPGVISHRLEVSEAIYDAFCDPIWAAQHLAKSMIDFPESAEILYHMARYCSLAYFFEPEDMPKKILSLKLLDQAAVLDPTLRETAAKESDFTYVLDEPSKKKSGKLKKRE
jgi:hypothetical protein